MSTVEELIIARIAELEDLKPLLAGSTLDYVKAEIAGEKAVMALLSKRTGRRSMTEIDKASSEYFRELVAIAQRNNCHCGKLLTVRWLGGAYHLGCNAGHIDEETVRVPSDWELWKKGIAADPYRDQDEARRKERRAKRAREF